MAAKAHEIDIDSIYVQDYLAEGSSHLFVKEYVSGSLHLTNCFHIYLIIDGHNTAIEKFLRFCIRYSFKSFNIN
jgi:thiaminase